MVQGAAIRPNQNNPKAFNNVAIGLGLVVFAAGGGVLTLIGQS
jgi:hypothetical protein